MHILYIDDDPAMRSLSAGFLRRFGHEVETAGDGKAGLEAALAGDYDLVITDHEMPRMTGLELIRELRSQGNFTPAIVASGAAIDPLADFEDLHVAAMLPKPFSAEDLIQSVMRVQMASRAAPRLALRRSTTLYRTLTTPVRWGINE